MDLSGSDLVIVVPLWRRTANLARLLRSIENTVPGAETVFVTNADDAAFDDLSVIPPSPAASRVLVVQWPGGTTGDYARKINAGYLASDRPVVFTGADDIEFTDGWYADARPLLSDTLDVTATARVGVVGTVDDCNDRTADGTLSTHSLVARWYADLGGAWQQPGTIYCEEYPHEYVDDELCEVARARSLYVHAFDSVVRHHHPNAGRAPMDETYERGRANSRASRALFNQRRRLWAAR